MNKKTFLLGVGAQKAGTSWLYEYLLEKKNAHRGFAKEYHVWDALYIPECKKPFEVKMTFPLPPIETRKRWLMQKSRWYYFYYFRSLLDSPGITITSDITPAYSGLNRNILLEIKNSFLKYGITTKVVFLMRDPVNRCSSLVAMNKHRGFIDKNVDHNDYIRKIYGNRSCEFRTRYDATIKELEFAFAPDDIYYGIYEEMFETDKIVKLSEFLGVETDSDFGNKIVNFSPKLSFDEGIKRVIAAHYRETYEFVVKRFPQTKKLWEGFRYI